MRNNLIGARRSLGGLEEREWKLRRPKAGIVLAHAYMDESWEQFLAEVQGLVPAGVDHGNVLRPLLERLARDAHDGPVVVRGSRIGAAMASRNIEVDDDATDFIAGGPLNPVKCRILLLFLLAAPLLNRAEIQPVLDLFDAQSLRNLKR